MVKEGLRAQAIALRRRGWSYGEILKTLPVSKGSLSLWLRGIPLTQRQRAAIHRRARNTGPGTAASQAAYRRRRESLEKEAATRFARLDLDRSSLAFVGAALYWAEGTKRKAMVFTNSDPEMIRLYMRWLRTVLRVSEDCIQCTVAVHLNNGLSYDEVQEHWVGVTDVSNTAFGRPMINPAVRGGQTGHKKRRLPYGILAVRIRKPQRFQAALAVLLAKMGKTTSFIDSGVMV